MRRWQIRATYPSGDEAWMRHGSRIGEGDIVKFTSQHEAELVSEGLRIGVDAGTIITVVRMRPDKPS